MAESPIPGSRFAHYRVERALDDGVGGFGRVYLARDERGTRVALKLLDPQPGNTRRASGFFRRELEAAQRVRSDWVAAVLDADVVAAQPWIAYEFIDGTPLSVNVRGSEMDVIDALRLFRDIARGLRDVHHAGLIHCDVTLDNIMRTRDGRGMLIDLGVAAFGTDSAYTQMGLGKAIYSAPERLIGARVYPRTDVWQLGVCLVRATAGHFPFRRTPAL